MKVFLFFLIHLPCLSFAQYNSSQDRYAVGDPETKHFYFNDLVDLIESQSGEKSLESSLGLILKTYPSFRENYILMYKSRSLQKSSFLYPRALLFGYEARFIITYNGHPEDHGYNGLETMEFNEEKGTFTFREIAFARGSFTVSKDNPAKCMRCHQASSRQKIDPRPNWEPYNLWLGAYSSASHGHKVYKPSSKDFEPSLYALFVKENEMYEKFLNEVAPLHERYKDLKPMEKSDRFGTYFPATFTQSKINRMTTNLTEALARLNISRILRLMEESPHFEAYKEAVYGGLGCGEIFLDMEISDWHKEQSSLNPKRHPNIKQFKTHEMIEFFFEPYNVDTSDWSMDFGTGGKFAFSSRFGTPTNFRFPFNKAFKKKFGLEEKSCDELKEIALQKTRFYWEKEKASVASNKPLRKNLIQRCAGCHSNYGAFGAPYIPFNDESKLKEKLNNKELYPNGLLLDEIKHRMGALATFDERMPADGYLPKQEELNELLDYLESLIESE